MTTKSSFNTNGLFPIATNSEARIGYQLLLSFNQGSITYICVVIKLKVTIDVNDRL